MPVVVVPVVPVPAAAVEVDDVGGRAAAAAVAVEACLLDLPPLRTTISTTTTTTTTIAPTSRKIAPPSRELGRSVGRGIRRPRTARVGAGSRGWRSRRPDRRASPSAWRRSAARARPGPVRDLGERLARHRAELGREHPRPRPLVGRLGEAVARLLGDLVGQLTEQVVGDQRAALGREAGVGSDSVERRQRPRPHRRPVDREQARDVVVAAATLQHEIEDRALVGGE